MPSSSFPDREVLQAAAIMSDMASDFGEQVGDNPTLGELLEVLSLATSTDMASAVKFGAKLKGGRRYRGNRESRIGELNDSIFVDAVEVMSHLRVQADVQNCPLASLVEAVIKVSNIRFEDFEIEQPWQLTAEVSKSIRKVKSGDVVAIPARSGEGYHMAVVLARNRFGTALGLFGGLSSIPRFQEGGKVPRRHVYTDEHMIANEVWRVVGCDASLLDLFSSDPEIYHAPGAFPGAGEFGSAETANGAVRPVSEDEARAVGLLSGTYRQVEMSEQVQAILDGDIGGNV